MIKGVSKEWLEMWEAVDDEIIFFYGFEGAFLGFTEVNDVYVTVYDADKCVEILMDKDGMEIEDAVEYFHYNVLGTKLGERTPLFLYSADRSEQSE
jgi:hypothetical protein